MLDPEVAEDLIKEVKKENQKKLLEYLGKDEKEYWITKMALGEKYD